MVSTLTLLAAVAVLVVAERGAPLPAEHAEEKTDTGVIVGVYAAVLLFAVGFQVHFSLNSAPQYLRVADKSELPWLLPVFWIGFNLLMFPASLLVKRIGAAPMLALAAIVGSLAAVVSALEISKGVLLTALALAAFARIGAVASGLAADPAFRNVLPWLPALTWALAAALVLAIRPASPASR